MIFFAADVHRAAILLNRVLIDLLAAVAIF